MLSFLSVPLREILLAFNNRKEKNYWCVNLQAQNPYLRPPSDDNEESSVPRHTSQTTAKGSNAHNIDAKKQDVETTHNKSLPSTSNNFLTVPSGKLKRTISM